MVRLLLRSGARVDAAGQTEQTPLMNAVKLNHPEVVELLLKAGANTRAKDRTGAGLLLAAINDDLPEVLAVLLRHGLDPNQPDADGLTPWYWANQLQREALTEQLVKAGARADVPRQTLRASRPYPKEDF
jgi:ankyrin repeat protein